MDYIKFYSHTDPMPREKFSRLYSIMEYSFPATERGSEAFHYSEYKRPEFRCMSYEPQGVPAGFLNYYDMEDAATIFVEHFAMEPSLRGRGTGSDMLRCFLDYASDSLVVLEVEPPEGDMEKRRIAFYQRIGLILNPGEYFQPEFYGKSPAIPLMLMTNKPISDSEFEDIKQLIHKRIYLK